MKYTANVNNRPFLLPYRLRTVAIAIAALFAQQAVAQDFTSILESIEKNSTTLLAKRKMADAEQKDTKVMTALDDPEVGFNYLFGNADRGKRYDVDISQAFDFPTTIARRSKLAREQRRVADLRYLTERQQILVEARKLCIEVVYCNAMMEHLNEDLHNTHAMAEAYQRLYEQGEATVINRNKAHQAVLFFEAEYREFNTNRENLLAQLRYMNNGEDVIISDTAFVISPLPSDFDKWLAENISRHPDLMLANGEVKAQERSLSVAKGSWAPKLRVGYMGEFEKEDSYQGPTIGLSLPIWSGKRSVKAAKAHLEAQEMERQDTQARISTQLRSIYNETLQLQQTIHEFSHHLSGCDNTAMLQKSLKEGQINLLTFLQELQYVHEMHERLLIAERDFKLREAEMMW